MADSMCGPSNPLQNFRKHASTDRTLQQDRLVSRPNPTSGFRTAPGPNAGLLDPEFEAFQAGFDPATLVHPEPYHHPQHQFSGPQFAQPIAAPAWALDFQRLNISQPQSPSFSHHARASHQPQPTSNVWHHEFERQQLHSASPQVQQPQFQPRFNGLSNYSGPSQYAYSAPMLQSDQDMQILDKGKAKQVEDQRDAAAFEKAFEDHTAELLRLEAKARSRAGSIQQNRPYSLGEEALMDDGSTLEDIQQRIAKLQEASDHMVAEELHHQQGHDLDHQQYMQDASQEHQVLSNDDELAQTARELLEKVSDNTTEKFQQSSFLAMMRKLRDGEMRVEGDQMVETHVTDASIPTPENTADIDDTDPGRTPHTMYGALNKDTPPLFGGKSNYHFNTDQTPSFPNPMPHE